MAHNCTYACYSDVKLDTNISEISVHTIVKFEVEVLCVNRNIGENLSTQGQPETIRRPP